MIKRRELYRSSAGADYDLHGKAVLDFRAEEGLRCTLRFPLEEAQSRDARNEPRRRDATH